MRQKWQTRGQTSHIPTNLQPLQNQNNTQINSNTETQKYISSKTNGTIINNQSTDFRGKIILLTEFMFS